MHGPLDLLLSGDGRVVALLGVQEACQRGTVGGLAVVGAEREKQERVDVPPLLEFVQALLESPDWHARLLHHVRVDGGTTDDRSLEELEQAHLRGAEPAPEDAVEWVGGKWDHVLESVMTLEEERLEPAEVEGL